MLGKFLIILRLLSQGTIRGLGGEAVHGFLLNAIAMISNEYAQKLHDSKRIKPFSVSPLFFENKDEGWQLENGYLKIKENINATIAISTLNESCLGIIMKALICTEKQKKKVNIGGLKAVVKKVCIKEAEGARFEKYSDIIKKAKKNEKVTFNLLTPLSFRQNGIQQTFPTPELVFSSLLQTWNAFSDIKIPEEIKDKFRSIVVSRYNLHSELWHFSKYKIFGCKGRIEYTFKDDFSESELRILNALSRFATYSGIGYKRTMGMGMVDVRFG